MERNGEFGPRVVFVEREEVCEQEGSNTRILKPRWRVNVDVMILDKDKSLTGSTRAK